jgi:hypothetical protein
MGKCVADFVCLSLTVQENIKRMVRDELENALRAGPRTAAMTGAQSVCMMTALAPR